MSEINIVTAQNVTLKIELANIGDRFLAAILDFLVKVGLTILTGIIIGVFRSAFMSFLGGGFLILLWTCYFLAFELAMNGQSPGKRVMKIRVARLDGGPLTGENILLRWLFRFLDFPLTLNPTIGICAIVISEKHQRLGDLVAGTILVSTKERVSLAENFNAEVAAGYIPSFPQAERLTSREIEIIQEVFYQYRERDKYDLITVTAAKVREFLGIQTGLDDFTLLKTVVTDYSFINSQQGKSFESKENFSYQP